MTLDNSSKEISIPMGGMAIGIENNILKTFVGSCVAVVIYDEEKKIGGMAHIMLPKNITNKSTKGTKQEGKFADEALDIIIERLNKISSDLELKAKMSGGAEIFQHESESGNLHIGNRNVIGIRTMLKDRNIPIIAQSVGEKSGRWVTFHCNTQRVIVKHRGEEKIL